MARSDGRLGVTRGTALYVGALMGPGVLLVPALAVQAAGPASVVAWGALLLLSVPLAMTFAALGVRHPVDGGIAVYVHEGIGERAAAAAGACFLTAAVIGGPAVALVGGFYVADLAGGGTAVAVLAAAGMLAVVLCGNALGVRVSSGLQLGLSAVLVLVLSVAVVVALPSGTAEDWTPFAPEGWPAVGTAANLLVWHFIGWEAMAQLAGEFRDPRRDLPKAVALAYAIVALLYVGLAVATVTVATGTATKVPLADLLAVGFDQAGRDATVVLALALTTGTMNVYLGGAARLTAALARDGALPAWLAGDAGDAGDVPRRPLTVIAVSGAALLGALGAGLFDAAGVVRATSACFLAVYVLALTAAVRMLTGPPRVAAGLALALVLVVTAFSAALLLVPLVAAAAAVGGRGLADRRRGVRRAVRV